LGRRARVYRGYLPRVVVPTLAALGLVGVVPAFAQSSATLYAAPGGSASGSCPSSDPCSLTQALTVAGTENGFDVTIDLASGAYSAQTVPNGSESSLTLDGPGAVIDGLTVSASSLSLTLDELSVENASPGIALTSAASLTLLDTALIDNTGDGLDASAGSVLVEDSTVAGNGAVGVSDDGASTLSIYGTTFEGNASGGLAVDGASANVGADLFYGNGRHDCSTSTGLIDDQGYNDSEDGSCIPTLTTSHDNDTSLQVAAAAANGGPNETARLQSVSDPNVDVPTGVTIGSETAPFCVGSDQRGVPRTQGPASACDAGAFQYAPPVVTSVSPRSALELGLSVTLNGYGFANGTTAMFGSTAATITSQSSGSLTLALPSSLALGSEPITLTNPDGSTQVAFNAVADPTVATWILAPGELKVPYSQPLPVAGGAGPYSYALLSGALPAGLTMSSSGVISGTPTKAGGSAFTVQVTDANGFASPTVDVSLVIATPVLTVTTTKLRAGAGPLPVALTCASAPCSGTVSVDESVVVKLGHDRKKTESVALATGAYSLSAGQSTIVELVLTPTGKHVLNRHALKRARKHPLDETLNATVAGGTTDTTIVPLS
jgi:hypothetical protein